MTAGKRQEAELTEGFLEKKGSSQVNLIHSMSVGTLLALQAPGSGCCQGVNVRMSGQLSQRGSIIGSGARGAGRCFSRRLSGRRSRVCASFPHNIDAAVTVAIAITICKCPSNFTFLCSLCIAQHSIAAAIRRAIQARPLPSLKHQHECNQRLSPANSQARICTWLSTQDSICNPSTFDDGLSDSVCCFFAVRC